MNDSRIDRPDLREDTATRLTKIEIDNAKTKSDVADIKAMLEPLVAAKGFFRTIKFISTALVFLVATGAAMAVLYGNLKGLVKS